MTAQRHDPMTALTDAIDCIGGAECAKKPKLFFPDERVMFPERKSIMEAKAICARCPIQVECLTYALESGEPHGIWGGLLPTER